MTTASTNTTCPYCGRANGYHSSVTTDRAPYDGAVAICWGCRRAGLFESTPFGLRIRIPSEEEQAELDVDPGIRATLAAAAESYTPRQAIDLLKGR